MGGMRQRLFLFLFIFLTLIFLLLFDLFAASRKIHDIQDSAKYLLRLGNMIMRYKQDNKRYPENFRKMYIPDVMLYCPVTGAPFGYSPRIHDKDGEGILVWQTAPLTPGFEIFRFLNVRRWHGFHTRGKVVRIHPVQPPTKSTLVTKKWKSGKLDR